MESLKSDFGFSLEKKVSNLETTKQYLKGCLDPNNARLYGTFQERAALNITQFHKIQGSLLIRMGMVYPIISYLVNYAGLPPETKNDLHGIIINYHTWIAGYLSYVVEIQLGLSKYPIEFAEKTLMLAKNYLKK